MIGSWLWFGWSWSWDFAATRGRGGLLGFGVSIRFVRRLGPGCGLDGPGA